MTPDGQPLYRPAVLGEPLAIIAGSLLAPWLVESTRRKPTYPPSNNTHTWHPEAQPNRGMRYPRTSSRRRFVCTKYICRCYLTFVVRLQRLCQQCRDVAVFTADWTVDSVPCGTNISVVAQDEHLLLLGGSLAAKFREYSCLKSSPAPKCASPEYNSINSRSPNRYCINVFSVGGSASRLP